MESHSFFCMGTVFEIKLHEVDSSLVKKTEEMCVELSGRLNLFDSTSILNEINTSEEASLDSLTCGVISSALRWYELSDGRFDPTVGELTILWNFNASPTSPPPDSILKKTLQRVGADKISLEDCVIKKPGDLKLDLGGIAKGFAVDLIYDTLLAYSTAPFLINGGGNIRVHGRDFRIAIRHPRDTEKIAASFLLKSSYACATSGDYQRGFIYQGKRYHHILDPRTGYPVSNNIVSVTIIATNATDADGASTSTFVMGREEALKFIEGRKELEGVIIWLDREGEMHYLMSDGITGFKEVSI